MRTPHALSYGPQGVQIHHKHQPRYPTGWSRGNRTQAARGAPSPHSPAHPLHMGPWHPNIPAGTGVGGRGGLAFGGSPGAGGLRDGREGIMEPIPLIDSISAAAGCGARSHQFDSGDGESDLERPCHQLAFIDGIAHWKSMGFEAGGGSSIPSNPRSRTGPHHSGVWGMGPTGGCPPGATRTPWHRPGKSQWAGVLGWRWAVLGGGHRPQQPCTGVLWGTDTTIPTLGCCRAQIPPASPHGVPRDMPTLHGGPTGQSTPSMPSRGGGVSWGISLTSIPILGPLGYRTPSQHHHIGCLKVRILPQPYGEGA